MAILDDPSAARDHRRWNVEVEANDGGRLAYLGVITKGNHMSNEFRDPTPSEPVNTDTGTPVICR